VTGGLLSCGRVRAREPRTDTASHGCDAAELIPTDKIEALPPPATIAAATA